LPGGGGAQGHSTTLTELRSLVPQPRLLWALGIGAALYALTNLSLAIWPLVIVYHGFVILTVIRDGRRLPSPAAFTVRREMDRPLSLGVRQEVELTVTARGSKAGWARIADHAPASLAAEPRETTVRFSASGVAHFSYQVLPVRRGAYTFGQVDVRYWRSGSMLARQVGIPASEEVRVFPDVVQIRTYQSNLRRGLRPHAGMRRTRPPGAATAFASLRDYLPGDDVRRVNWRATARRDRPITGEVEAERGQEVVLAIDCGRLMAGRSGALTKLDHAINAALLLAWTAHRLGDRVGLVTFADRVLGFLPPRPGAAQVTSINHALCAIQASTLEPEYQGTAAFIARRVPRRSLVVMLTDVLDLAASATLVASCLQLAHRHLVLVAALSDPAVAEAIALPITHAARAYEWVAAEELVAERRTAFEALRRGGVPSLDVRAGELSARLVERYLELRERALI